jgi:hypothetical protein
MLLTVFLVSDQQALHLHQTKQGCGPFNQIRLGKTTYRPLLSRAAQHCNPNPFRLFFSQLAPALDRISALALLL